MYFSVIAHEYTDVSEVRILVNDVEKGTMIFEQRPVNEWATQQCKATFAAGKQKVRLNFKRGGLKLNWFEITKNEAPSSVLPVVENRVSIYPIR
jgi:hypothetical protein